MIEPVPPDALDLDDAGLADWYADSAETEPLERWQVLAEWFEEEGISQPSSEERSVCLLAASELRAQLGELVTARKLAERADTETPGSALTQSRQLALADQDLDAVERHVASSLSDAHAKHRTPGKAQPEPSPADVAEPVADLRELRAHLYFLRAELNRLSRADIPGCSEALRQAQLLRPSDPRPPLFQFARQFVSEAATSVSWPSSPGGKTLSGWAKELEELWRGPTDADRPVSAQVGLYWAQTELRRGNLARAVRLLAALETVSELAAAAAWLRGLVGSLLPGGLALARLALERATHLQEAPDAGKRHVALLALGSRSPEQAGEDIAELAAAGLLDADDQIAFALLTDTRSESAPLPAAPGLDFVGTLFGYLQAADFRTASTDDAVLRIWLGLALGEPLAELSPWLPQGLRAAHPREFLELLELERHAATGSDSLPSALAHYYSVDQDSALAANLAAALTCEQTAKSPAVAGAFYRALLDAPVFTEPALRALGQGGQATPDDMARSLAALGPGPQRAFLTCELALAELAAGKAPPELAAEDAAAAPLAQLIVEFTAQVHAARTQDFARWTQLLRERRAAATHDAEVALLLVVEAMHPRAERAARTALLSKAQACRPGDVSIHLARSCYAPAGVAATASQLEELAQNTPGVELRAALLLASSWYRELSFNPQHAARLAKESGDIFPSDLAQQCFERTAPGTELESVLLEQRSRQVLSVEPAGVRAHYALELAQMALRRGERSKEGYWLRESLRLAPADLHALLEAEQHAFETSDHPLLAEVELALAKVLPPGEREPHLELACRLMRLHQDWPAAHGLLREADPKRLSVQALRELQSRARRVQDHSVSRSVCEELSTRVAGAYDRSRLLYEAASAAARLQQGRDALDLFERSLRASPDNLLAQAGRADWLERLGDGAAAAMAYEQVAELSASTEHAAEALLSAGRLWSQAGEAELASAAFEGAFSKAPHQGEIVRALGAIYEARGDREALLDLTRRALPHATGDATQAELVLQKARLLTELDQPGEAASALDKLVREQPSHMAARLRLAELLKAEQPEQAEAILLEIPRQGAPFLIEADAYRALAQLYEGTLESPRRAERCYREVLKRNADDREATEALARLRS